ncbi:MAG: hypothetical protein Q9220_001581 [cf. Caloplaca sp. 1 TL-2023]
MAGNREERFLMRQRGAGTRDIELAFDLQLPGISKFSRTPLKTQSPSRSRKLPQPESARLRSTRRTPKSAAVLSKSISRKTPATARGNKSKKGITPSKDVIETTVHDPKGSQDTSHDDDGIAIKRRKTAASAPQSRNILPTTAVPRTRRKRKSIGQQSLIRRSRRPTIPSKSIPLLDASLETKEVEPTELKSGEDQVDEPFAVLTRTYNGNDLSTEPAPTVPMPESKQIKRRKRKSVGQIQKPKKKSRSVQEPLYEDASKQAELDEAPAATHNVAPHSPIDNKEKARSRRQKKVPVAEMSVESKKLASDRISTIVSEPVQELRDRVAAIESDVHPVKRGRKPRVLSEQKMKTPEEKVDSDRIPIEHKNDDEAFHVRDAEPDVSNTSVATKRKVRRKPITQIRRPKKQTTSKSIEETPILTELVDPKYEDGAAAAAGVLPVPRRRGRPKKAPLPPAAEIPPTSVVATENTLEPALPVSKWSRVKNKPEQIKKDAPRSAHRKATANWEGHRTNRPKDSTKSAGNPIISTSQDEPTTVAASLSNHSTVPAPIIKKRGRPRKQPPKSPAVDEVHDLLPVNHLQSQIQRNSLTAPSRITRTNLVKPSQTPSSLAYHIKHSPPSTDHTTNDLPPHRQNPRSKPSFQIASRSPPQPTIEPTRSSPSSTSTTIHHPISSPASPSNSDPLSSSAIFNPPTTTRNKTNNNIRKRPFPNKQNTIIPMLDNHLILNPTNTTTSNRSDLDTHIRSSLDEESTHRHDLQELRQQQSIEMQEQRDREIQSRLDDLRDSVRKRREQQQEQRESTKQAPPNGFPPPPAFTSHAQRGKGVASTAATDTMEPGHGGMSKGGSRALTRPLFRSVSGTAAAGRQKGQGRGRVNGDIDPDLQGMLDQVKGLSGIRDEGVVKFF